MLTSMTTDELLLHCANQEHLTPLEKVLYEHLETYYYALNDLEESLDDA